MADTTQPHFKARVPAYWLALDPILLSEDVPHAMAGNFPSYTVDGGVPLGGTATDAAAGTPGHFFPLGSVASVTDLATLKADVNMGDAVGPSDGNWDTKGQYILLGDGSEAHYRLDVWAIGRVP